MYRAIFLFSSKISSYAYEYACALIVHVGLHIFYTAKLTMQTLPSCQRIDKIINAGTSAIAINAQTHYYLKSAPKQKVSEIKICILHEGG